MLPRLEADYAQLWADWWENSGGSVKEEAENRKVYLEVLEDLAADRFKIPGVEGPKLALAIKDYAAAEFRKKKIQRSYENIYHDAFVGFLYRVAVQQLANGDLAGWEDHREAGTLIERQVDRIFMARHEKQ